MTSEARGQHTHLILELDKRLMALGQDGVCKSLTWGSPVMTACWAWTGAALAGWLGLLLWFGAT